MIRSSPPSDNTPLVWGFQQPHEQDAPQTPPFDISIIHLTINRHRLSRLNAYDSVSSCSEWYIVPLRVFSMMKDELKNEGFCRPPLLLGLVDKSLYIWSKADDSWMKEISVIFSCLTQLIHLPLHSSLEINQNGTLCLFILHTSESVSIAVYVSANTPGRRGPSCSAMKRLQLQQDR